MARGLASILAIAMLGSTSLSAQTVQAPASPAAPQFHNFPTPPRAPKGAPNILLVMTDDVGFAASSTFGGPVPMPNYDALAARGFRYNNFHTSALCSPSRASLLTGRNHHRVGFGALADMATDEPGYDGIIPASAATIGQVLKGSGYDTSWFGKNHNTPPWEISPFGPFDRWPIGFGFNYFYGFNSAATDQFTPTLTENINDVRPYVGHPDYVLDRDLADHAIRWLDVQKSVHQGQPFLMYWAPGTAHGPTQAPDEWLAKFRGKFDMGWDKVREQSFQRQKAMGIIPAGTKMTPRPPEVPAWDSLAPGQQRVAARMMEAHAAQLAFFDEQFGRVIAELKRLGEYDNTLIIYIQGDNGASQEAGVEGTNNNYAALNGNAPSWAQMAQHADDIGTRRSSMAIPAGWAYALNTPFPWSKGIASHLGGQMDGMVVSWPGHIDGHGQVLHQYTHLIDVAPTLYQAAGITPPAEVNGTKQMPLDGISFTYTFTDPKAPSRHTEQYYEMVGNRALYKDGWMANTTPSRAPWVHGPDPIEAKDYKWELYNLDADYTQSNNLAQKYPEKLAELRKAFDAAAARNDVEPLSSDVFDRMFKGKRPTLMSSRQSTTYYPGPTRYSTGMFPDFPGHSWTATAEIDVPQGGGDGTLVSQGGWAMGWGLFVIDNKPWFVYRPSDHDPEVRIAGPALTPGRHQIQSRFTLDPAPSRGGTASLLVDGKDVGNGRVARSWAFMPLSAAVGQEGDDTILPDHPPPFAYRGRLDHVTIDILPGR